MKKFVECDIYIADYTEDTEKLESAPIIKDQKAITNCMVVVNYPFFEGHVRVVEWKNDIKYLAEEICGFVKEIYDTGDFSRANHGIEDLWLEGIGAVTSGHNVIVTAFIGS